VTNISSAAKTATEINAAYQPLDDAADDFEYQVGKALRQLLALQGIDAEPVFKRNRISNVKEQVETVALEAQWLDRRTILDKLPNLTPDEVAEILDRTDSEDMGRLVSGF
jgi:negative regulator of sigma E activity